MTSFESLSKTLLNSMVSRLLAMGALVTLATGSILTRSGCIGPYGFFEYGFPFTWRTELGATSTTLWFFLFLDVFFFAATGYLIVVASRARRGRWETKALPSLLVAFGYVVIVTASTVWIYSHPPLCLP